MPTLLDLIAQRGIETRRVSAAEGGEWAGPCPLCGGRDRFRVWPEKTHDGRSIAPPGRYWCRQCGIQGDAIDYLRRVEGLSFGEACARLGIERPGRAAAPAYRPAPTLADPRDWTPREYAPPTDAWREQAEALLARAQERLAGDADAQDWLTMRGITPRAAKIYGIGYHVSSSGGDSYGAREAWGLAPELKNGKPKRLWIPRGWVIPARDAEGRLHQLRVRRRPEDVRRFAQGVKYMPVEGSSQATLVLHPEAPAFAVVESGFDAVLLAAITGGAVGAICAWSAAARPDARAHALLSACLCVLLALDYDPAGDKESAWWQARYRHALRLPRLGAKDPGDAAAYGTDLYAWLRDGMPRGLAMRLRMVARNNFQKREKHDEIIDKKHVEPVGAFDCDRGGQSDVENGGLAHRYGESAVRRHIESGKIGLECADGHTTESRKGNRSISPDLPRTTPIAPDAHRAVIAGREIYICNDRAQWQALAKSGAAVFTTNEAERLRPVLSGMTPEEREQAVGQICDAKAILGGYITEARA